MLYSISLWVAIYSGRALLLSLDSFWQGKVKADGSGRKELRIRWPAWGMISKALAQTVPLFHPLKPLVQPERTDKTCTWIDVLWCLLCMVAECLFCLRPSPVRFLIHLGKCKCQGSAPKLQGAKFGNPLSLAFWSKGEQEQRRKLLSGRSLGFSPLPPTHWVEVGKIPLQPLHRWQYFWNFKIFIGLPSPCQLWTQGSWQK